MVTQMVSAERAAALRNKCLSLAKTCRSGSGPASERTSQSRQLMSAFGHISDVPPAAVNVRFPDLANSMIGAECSATAVRGMNGYGMTAVGAKRSFVRLITSTSQVQILSPQPLSL